MINIMDYLVKYHQVKKMIATQKIQKYKYNKNLCKKLYKKSNLIQNNKKNNKNKLNNLSQK